MKKEVSKHHTDLFTVKFIIVLHLLYYYFLWSKKSKKNYNSDIEPIRQNLHEIRPRTYSEEKIEFSNIVSLLCVAEQKSGKRSEANQI